MRIGQIIYSLRPTTRTAVDLEALSEHLQKPIINGYLTLKYKHISIKLSRTGFQQVFFKGNIACSIRDFIKSIPTLKLILQPFYKSKIVVYKGSVVNIQATAYTCFSLNFILDICRKQERVLVIPRETGQCELKFESLGSAVVTPSARGTCRLDIVTKSLERFSVFKRFWDAALFGDI